MSDADKQLMIAALRQLDGKLDYTRLARDLGIPNVKTAGERWSRFKAKLNNGASQPQTPQSNSTRTTAPTTPRSANRKLPSQSNSPTKKRKMAISNDEDQIDIPSETMFGNGDDGRPPITQPLLETPTRRLPTRKARMTSFKEESSEDDICVEENDAESGHDGTPTEESVNGLDLSEDEA